MKIIRFLLLAVFVLSTALTGAQAAGQSVGYVRLLAHVDSRTPIQIQTRQALDALMPRLLALKQQGIISEFEPELRMGVLKVKYSTGANLATLVGRGSYGTLRAAAASVPQANSSPALRGTSITPVFYPTVYDSCFYAFSLGASSDVVGSLRDTTGRVVASYEGAADAGGFLSDCFSWNGAYADMLPGYKLTFKVYDPGAVLLGTYAALVPNIGITTVDKAQAIVGGFGPHGKSYDIDWIHPNLNASRTTTTHFTGGTISAAGLWQNDFGALTIRGGDELDLYVLQSRAFQFERYLWAPYIYCQLGSNYCDVYGIASQPASLTIVHAGVAHTVTGTFSTFGNFSETLMNGLTPIFLVAGDLAGGTSVATYPLPTLTTSVNFSTNVISGKAPANKYFWVSANTPADGNWYDIWAHSSSASSYAANFTSQIDLVATHAVNVEVHVVNPATGNDTDYFSSVGP